MNMIYGAATVEVVMNKASAENWQHHRRATIVAPVDECHGLLVWARIDVYSFMPAQDGYSYSTTGCVGWAHRDNVRNFQRAQSTGR